MNLFGKDKKKQDDLDTGYYARQKAYNEGLQEERVKIAREKGREAAHKLANSKPLYQKVIGVGQAVMKDLAAPGPKDGVFSSKPTALFTWEDPKPKRKRKRRRR